MIGLKNLQYLNEVLVQEELLQVKTKHLCDLAGDKKVVALLKDINDQSVKAHGEVLKYLEGHL